MRFALAQRVFRHFALEKLPDMAPDEMRALQHFLVRALSVLAEKLHYADDVAASLNRERKCRPQARCRCCLRAREMLILRDIGNPSCFLAIQHPADQSGT